MLVDKLKKLQPVKYFSLFVYYLIMLVIGLRGTSLFFSNLLPTLSGMLGMQLRQTTPPDFQGLFLVYEVLTLECVIGFIVIPFTLMIGFYKGKSWAWLGSLTFLMSQLIVWPFVNPNSKDFSLIFEWATLFEILWKMVLYVYIIFCLPSTTKKFGIDAKFLRRQYKLFLVFLICNLLIHYSIALSLNIINKDEFVIKRKELAVLLEKN